MMLSKYSPVTITVAVALSMLLGCGQSSPVEAASQGAAIVVRPQDANVLARGTTAFSAAVTGTVDVSVDWYVLEGSAGGTVTGGVYLAPATAGTYHVVARSAASGAEAQATVVVLPPGASTGTVESVYVHDAVATTGSTVQMIADVSVNGAPDKSLTWSVDSGSIGSIDPATGVYTAPATAGKYTVWASSNADPTKKDYGFIVVSAPGGTPPTPPAPPPPTQVGVHYVAHGGSDSAPGTLAAPWATISSSLRKLAPGETLVIRGASTDAGDAIWNEGLLWATSVAAVRWGTGESTRITIKAYPGEVVRLQGTVNAGLNVIHIGCDSPSVPLGGGPTPCPGGRCSSACPSYITVGGADGKLILDARNAKTDAIQIGNSARDYDALSTADRDIAGTGPHHLRFVGVEVRNAGLTLSPPPGIPGAQGLFIAGDYNEFIDMNFHDNGAETTNHDHAIYVTGKRNTFRGGEIHHNTQGIQVWSNNNGVDNAENLFENLNVHDNGRNPANGHAVSGSRAMGSGIGIYCGTGNVVRNSVFVGNYQAGVYVGYGTRGTVVTGNTVHDNNTNPEVDYAGRGGIGVTSGVGQCGAAMPSYHEDGTSRQHGAENTSVANNALWSNRGGTMLSDTDGRYQIFNTATTTSCGGTCPGSNRLGP
jgi:hypothetical protein